MIQIIFMHLISAVVYKIKRKTNIDLDNINRDTLDELFHYYGSDKANIFKITQDQGHGFSAFYSQNLKHLKEREIKMLEIGASLFFQIYDAAHLIPFKHIPASDPSEL